MSDLDDTDEEIIRCIQNGDETPTRKLTRIKHVNDGNASKKTRCTHKRKRATQTGSLHAIDTYEIFDRFKRRRDSLRLSASSIAAMTGFHPYSNLGKLLVDLVYQGPVGKMLMQHDAKLLGIEIISEYEALNNIAKKAGSAVKNAFQQALDISLGNKKVKSVQVANGIKTEIISMIDKSNLSISEKKLLQEASRSGVNTGFGKEHEDDALDIYEKMCGYDVLCRNEELKCWKFYQNADGEVSPIGPPESLYKVEKIEKYDQRHQEQDKIHDKDDKFIKNEPRMTEVKAQPKEIDLEVSKDNDNRGLEEKSSNTERAKQKIFFSIVGVADGVRDEFYAKENEALQQKNGEMNDIAVRAVVVECKHRMKKAFIPPPLYDQIQAVLYCMMYGTSEAEIIQVVRNTSKKEQSVQHKADIENKTENMVNLDGNTKKPEASTIITCDRISLNDPIMQHGKNWKDTILPRLVSFVNAIYSVRQEDGKRYRLITAFALASSGGDEGPSWNILFEECPWLKECDLAVSKR